MNGEQNAFNTGNVENVQWDSRKFIRGFYGMQLV